MNFVKPMKQVIERKGRETPTKENQLKETIYRLLTLAVLQEGI